MIKKALIPLAGLGTRLFPVTKSVPKELLPVVNKPVLYYSIAEAMKAGIKDFIFIISEGKKAIREYFSEDSYLEQYLESSGNISSLEKIRDIHDGIASIKFVVQEGAQGLGHAILQAKKEIDSDLLIILPDELFFDPEGCSSLAEMIALYNKKRSIVMSAYQVERAQVHQYGIFDIESINGRVIKTKGIVEKPKVENAPSSYANIGRYILPYDIFEILEEQYSNNNREFGELQLTSAIAILMKKFDLFAYLFEGHRFDCGNGLGLIDASIYQALYYQDTRSEMLAILEKYK